MKTIFALILALAVACASGAEADDGIVIGGLDGLSPDDSVETYAVALALSGGGARGLATVGILKAFEEKNLGVAAIAGTSMGGIIGGLYACGYSADQLEGLVRTIDLTSLFSNRPARSTMFLTQRQERDRHLLSLRFQGFRPIIPRALTAGQRLTSILTNLTTGACYHAEGDFDKLAIPFRTISADIVSGEEIVMSSGSLADAMRATMAFPLAFTPVEDGGRLLMDGGLVTPIPVQLARSLVDSVDFAVAVNTTSPLLPKDGLVTPVDIANQVTSIMSTDKLNAQLALADYVIAPLLDSLVNSDFDKRDRFFQAGYEAGLSGADSILALLRERARSKRIRIAGLTFDRWCIPFALALRDSLSGLKFTRAELTTTLRGIARRNHLFRLEARLSAPHAADDSLDRRLDLKAIPQLIADSLEIAFEGNSTYPDSVLRRAMRLEGGFVTQARLAAGLDSVLGLYHRSGYDLAQVRSADIDLEQGVIQINIDEAIIREMEIVGNIRTRDWFVKSYFPLKVNQPYSTQRASRGLANIYGTDLFDRVTAILLPRGDGATVRIGVEEKENRQFRLGWRWDDRYQSEELIEFLDDNVFGIGLQYMLHFRIAPERQKYSIFCKTNRIFSTYLTSRAGVYHHRLERDLFDAEGDLTGARQEDKTGLEAAVGQQIARLGTLSTAIAVERTEYEYADGSPGQNFDLRMLRFESLVENFNRANFPETGKKHFFELRLAGKFLGGDVEYTRFFSSIEAYWMLARRLNYHPRLAVGLSRSGLPPSEKFYLGGMNSFTGFRANQMAGDKVVHFSQELRLGPVAWTYLILRHDLGEVYSSIDHVKLSGLRQGLGVALAVDTPIGPFELGYGRARDDNDRFERTYFSVGLTF